MAHFVQMNKNICGQVIVVNNEVITNEAGLEIEQLGIDFCKSLYGENTEWLQTSYNGKFRGRYAGSGMIYDIDKDEFIIPGENI